MIALIQRVITASVLVNDETIANIDTGLLVLLAVERGDSEQDAVRMSERLAAYRVFSDQNGKMNLSVSDIRGEILLVPQFTLAADTTKGLRPSFHGAAEPVQGQKLFEVVAAELRVRRQGLQLGQFGADMQVQLINNGPVTFLLESRS